MKYYEASAMENIGVDVFMSEIMTEIYTQRESSFADLDEKSGAFQLKPAQPAAVAA